MYLVTLTTETATNVHDCCASLIRAEECMTGVTLARYEKQGEFEADVGDNESVFISSIPATSAKLFTVTRMTSRSLN